MPQHEKNQKATIAGEDDEPAAPLPWKIPEKNHRIYRRVRPISSPVSDSPALRVLAQEGPALTVLSEESLAVQAMEALPRSLTR